MWAIVQHMVGDRDQAIESFKIGLAAFKSLESATDAGYRGFISDAATHLGLDEADF